MAAFFEARVNVRSGCFQASIHALAAITQAAAPETSLEKSVLLAISCFACGNFPAAKEHIGRAVTIAQGNLHSQHLQTSQHFIAQCDVIEAADTPCLCQLIETAKEVVGHSIAPTDESW